MTSHGKALALPVVRRMPEVVIDGDQVRMGEAANTTVLKKAEWNVPVDLIRSGQLGRV